MSAVHDGAQWASGRQLGVSPSRLPRRGPSSSSIARRRVGIVILSAIAMVVAIAAPSGRTAAASGALLMPRSELLALPTSGTAWSELKSVADSGLGTPNLCDIDDDHHLRTLAAALVYARTGTASYGSKARAGVMAAIPTLSLGCSQAVLSLGRQLAAYVLAADLADLAGADDTVFRAWLGPIRTKDIGGHDIWDSLTFTHRDSANNWGAYAGASRIAASLYLGDSADVAAAAKVTQGFLGDRSAYAGFGQNLDGNDLSWSCSGASTYTPENPACTKSGINVDGGFIADISRSGSLEWPPGGTGVQYQLDSIQGMGLQTELLFRNGYGGAWGWSSSALKRAAALVTRSKADGGMGWNETNTARQMPWLLNARFGTSIPTQGSGMGRAIGFTDWLYGGGGAPSPDPTPKPTPKPTVKPTPTPAPAPTPAPTPTPAAGSAPVVGEPRLRLARTSSVPLKGVRAVVAWSLERSSNGVRRYDLQMKRDGGSYTTLALSSATARTRWLTLAAGSDYRFRVRAVDRSGRIGAWRTIGPLSGSRVNDASTLIGWAGSWKVASSTKYIASRVHYTRSSSGAASLTFSGTSIAWVGPTGPTRGKARVYVDGTLVATVDLYSRTFVARRIVFATTVANGTHTVTVRGLGTAGRPMVAVDAFMVIHPS